VTTRKGIPCTTVARTIVDLAAVVVPRRLERTLGQAEVLRLSDRKAIEVILSAKPAGAGTRMLKGLLDRHDPSTSLTRSDLEEEFLAL
jgi:hypothetical protein